MNDQAMNDNIFKYMVRLTPAGSYFFGGETTFGNGENQNYLVRSRLMPQVSAVLGVLRYEILRRKGLLETGGADDGRKKDQWSSLIGEPFSIENPSSSYGIISGLSPVFIERKTDGVMFTPCPLDKGYDVSFDKGNCISYSDSGCRPQTVILKSESTENGKSPEPFSFKGFDNWQKWIGTNGDVLIESDIFHADASVGITKNDWARKKAYFEQTQIRLGKDFRFCFKLTTSEPFPPDGQSVLVYMGGNRSMFRLEMEAVSDIQDSDPVELFRKKLHREGRLMILGEAFIQESVRDKLDFIWGESVVNRYVANTHRWNGARSGKLYHLLSRGSVIYNDDASFPEELTTKENNLRKVGLNIFI